MLPACVADHDTERGSSGRGRAQSLIGRLAAECDNGELQVELAGVCPTSQNTEWS